MHACVHTPQANKEEIKRVVNKLNGKKRERLMQANKKASKQERKQARKI